jgi:tRNA threonylcarbamoyladenosine biosynthesis protein TsaE
VAIASPLAARTWSVEETRALAGSLAVLAQPGDLILLSGDLGAGKTAFVQGFGRALGVDEPITSPTFVLAQRYEGVQDDRNLVIHHLDVYRLDQLSEFHDLGVGELLDEDGLVLIEWGDAVVPALPGEYMHEYLGIRLTFGDDADQRDLVLHPVGARWSARREQLAKAIDPWAGTDGNGDRGGDRPGDAPQGPRAGGPAC